MRIGSGTLKVSEAGSAGLNIPFFLPVYSPGTGILLPDEKQDSGAPALFCDLAGAGPVLVGPVIDVQGLFRRLGMGVVPRRTGDLMPGVVRRVRTVMGRRVVPGLKDIPLPVLAYAGRTAVPGRFLPAIGGGCLCCHVQ